MTSRQGTLRAILAVAALAFVMLVSSAPASRAAVVVPRVPEPTGSISGVLELAKRELNRNVRERKSDNVPRYGFGRGKIAPYSIGDAWCAAFATWVWGENGFTDYLGAKLLWVSYGNDIVAIQVRDLTRWAKKNGHFSTRAKPGYMVTYGGTHMGIVTKADRTGRAVKSIEGNKSDSVTRVTISMPDVTGYISPKPLSRKQVKTMRSLRPDM